MGFQVYTNCKLFCGGYDFSANMNKLAVTYEAKGLDVTTFGQATEINAGGLKAVKFSHAGLWDSVPDGRFFTIVGSDGEPVTIAPSTGAEGETCCLLKTFHSSYSPGAPVGDALKFSISGNSDLLIRGKIAANKTAVAASGSGTAYQLGAVASGKKLYAALHVLGASGTLPTLDVIVESDNAEGFPSPITRISFAQKTAIGSEWGQVAGPITDDWFRVSFVIGGVAPSFDFVISFGIGD